MLRKWQHDCATLALNKYLSGRSHFFCQATPGAGKTVFAAEVAKRLLESNAIDLVLCFSPTISVAESIKRTFAHTLSCNFNGGLGAIGQSLTYQSIQFLNEEFWSLLTRYRVFVVFDEIHHCAGSEEEDSNKWGNQILSKVQGLAKYTLALSGTPWRSDELPIVMAEYSDPEGQLIVDYQYSLRQAIDDRVCRLPKIVLIDNEQLTITKNRENQSFSSIAELLKETKTTYQSIIHNDDSIEYLLDLGCRKLSQIRMETPNAGGLVVAASVQHAKKIRQLLLTKFKQSASIVTYLHDEPLSEIDAYRTGSTQWIVSVGMISEGTDIPRLQVCCHLSSIKTELYFRQVLGRILRVNNKANQEAWLFTFAEPSLIEYSERIEQDIPDTCMFAKFSIANVLNIKESDSAVMPFKAQLKEGAKVDSVNWVGAASNLDLSQSQHEQFNDLKLGRFKQRVLSAFVL
ncbi:DEAD/DEAH box helicase family protein [Vibrio cholerae]|nr:DEAD/DEAH box helicase family protein [Vibrio cholerae]